MGGGEQQDQPFPIPRTVAAWPSLSFKVNTIRTPLLPLKGSQTGILGVKLKQGLSNFISTWDSFGSLHLLGESKGIKTRDGLGRHRGPGSKMTRFHHQEQGRASLGDARPC